MAPADLASEAVSPDRISTARELGAEAPLADGITGLVDSLPASSPRPRLKTDTLKGDLSGGFLAAVISVAESIPYGLLVFAPLGLAAAAEGVMAGLYASIFAAFVAALFGGTQNLISGPRASTSVIMAIMVATLAKAPDLNAHGGVPMAIALSFFGVLLAGALQILFGAAKLGRIIKFAPYPVIAGFMNGVAILLFLSQVKFLLGLPERFHWSEWQMIGAQIQPWTFVVSAITIIAIVLGPRITRHVPSLVVGLAVGIATYYFIADQVGLDVMGPVVGEIPPATFSLAALAPVFSEGWSPWMLARIADITPIIFVLAVIASIDSLMGAAALDSLTYARHNSNRELIAQGLANMTSGVVGGLACSGALARSAASYHSGARTRLNGIAHAGFVLLITLAAGPWVGTIPRAVLAAILTVVAIGMMDAWSRELVLRLKAAGHYRREVSANLVVVIAVAFVTVAVNLIAAVATGMLIAMVLFVTQMSKSIVRRVYDGRQRRSLKVRDREDAELLAAHGDKIAVVELDGPLFFGTADALLHQAESGSTNAEIIVLDFRRVSEMDATGVRLLQVLARTISTSGRHLLMAHITPSNDFGQFIAAIGGRHLFTHVLCFADTDAALEWAEDRLVVEYTENPRTEQEMALSELCITEGFSANDIDLISRYVERQEFEAGQVLFHEGAAGDALYLLVRGTVTIRLMREDGEALRLATLIPGVMFGEMALLERQTRSADAVATSSIVVYKMDQAHFLAILANHPVLATQLIANMARAIAARLRVTSDHLRAVS
ncbi:MAG: SLC26A/SulP transporter family protein [Rhodospirillaceae bacterium]|nr:SLC26A/SulP transporter family protein [Rhodospirillaceae bacterium]